MIFVDISKETLKKYCRNLCRQPKRQRGLYKNERELNLTITDARVADTAFL